jgi:hypothetical protein
VNSYLGIPRQVCGEVPADLGNQILLPPLPAVQVRQRPPRDAV